MRPYELLNLFWMFLGGIVYGSAIWYLSIFGFQKFDGWGAGSLVVLIIGGIFITLFIILTIVKIYDDEHE